MADNFDKTQLAVLSGNTNEVTDVLKNSFGNYLKDYDIKVAYKKNDYIYHKTTNGYKFMRAKVDVPKGTCTTQTILNQKFEVIDFQPSIPGITTIDKEIKYGMAVKRCTTKEEVKAAFAAGGVTQSSLNNTFKVPHTLVD